MHGAWVELQLSTLKLLQTIRCNYCNWSNKNRTDMCFRRVLENMLIGAFEVELICFIHTVTNCCVLKKF